MSKIYIRDFNKKNFLETYDISRMTQSSFVIRFSDLLRRILRSKKGLTREAFDKLFMACIKFGQRNLLLEICSKNFLNREAIWEKSKYEFVFSRMFSVISFLPLSDKIHWLGSFSAFHPAYIDKIAQIVFASYRENPNIGRLSYYTSSRFYTIINNLVAHEELVYKYLDAFEKMTENAYVWLSVRVLDAKTRRDRT